MAPDGLGDPSAKTFLLTLLANISTDLSSHLASSSTSLFRLLEVGLSGSLPLHDINNVSPGKELPCPDLNPVLLLLLGFFTEFRCMYVFQSSMGHD